VHRHSSHFGKERDLYWIACHKIFSTLGLPSPAVKAVEGGKMQSFSKITSYLWNTISRHLFLPSLLPPALPVRFFSYYLLWKGKRDLVGAQLLECKWTAVCLQRATWSQVPIVRNWHERNNAATPACDNHKQFIYKDWNGITEQNYSNILTNRKRRQAGLCGSNNIGLRNWQNKTQATNWKKQFPISFPNKKCFQTAYFDTSL
jgi:hypothetical protein